MDPAPASASPAVQAVTALLPPISPSKIRLMCSYGGRIVPRAHDNSLFYAGGDTRIVSVDRRTTAASFVSLYAHLSRNVFQNCHFLLKYQLPNEDLDSLISVVSDEDVVNMLEEHDRISPTARIRLFLFPVEAQSLDRALLGLKSDAWFSDALKSSRILQKGHNLEEPLATGTINVAGGGSWRKLGAESMLLETSSSFESSSSSLSMSNSPLIGKAPSDEKGPVQNRVSSSASMESDNSAGSAAVPLKIGAQEPVDQVPNSALDASLNAAMDKAVKVLVPQHPDGKMQLESQLPQYVPQYACGVPISPYYPYYPSYHTPFQSNQPYPVYLVPIGHSQYHNASMTLNSFDANGANFSSSQAPLHLQTETVFNPEQLGTQVPESGMESNSNLPCQLTRISSDQALPVMQPPERLVSPEPFQLSL